MTRESLKAVLDVCDAGGTVDAMCAASGLKPSRVYGILREHRPKRARQARRRTSDIPDKVRALAAIDTPRPRIAALLKVTRAYVHAILGPIGR